MNESTKDAFWSQAELECRKREQMECLLFIFLCNSVLLFAICVGWINIKDLDAALNSLLMYFLFLMFVVCPLFRDFNWRHYALRLEKPTLISDSFRCLRNWRDFSKSKNIATWIRETPTASLAHGDYVVLQKDEKIEYLRVSGKKQFYARDIDFNDIKEYSFAAIDPCTQKIQYEQKGRNYNCVETICNLNKQIESDGYKIVGVVDKYGFFRWEQSDEETKPLAYRRHIYRLAVYVWYTLFLLLLFAPAIAIVYKAVAS